MRENGVYSHSPHFSLMRALLLAGALALGGCQAPLVSPYDEAIEKGIVEFYEQLNYFVRDVAEAAGKPQGTYEANANRYNVMETKLDVLILRASSRSLGKGCKLEAKVYEKVAHTLGSSMPADMKPQGDAGGDAHGCNTRLLELVKQQLGFIKEIHAKTDKCGSPPVSCLRPATAGTALKIANQSIAAVAVVEGAKRN
jgi:hypothetical protein